MNFGTLIVIILLGSTGLFYDLNAEFEEIEKIPETTIMISEIRQSFDIMPVSDYIRPYNMTKTGTVWRAINGSSYIDPTHEVVQWYVRNTILNETGLYYLDGKMVKFDYYPDFGYENEDYWLNADYYLSHGLEGDCEDFTIGIASIMEAKRIPNMLVMTSKYNSNHMYLEYFYNGKYYVANTKYPIYQLRDDYFHTSKMESMFNINNEYTTYNKNWINYN